MQTRLKRFSRGAIESPSAPMKKIEHAIEQRRDSARIRFSVSLPRNRSLAPSLPRSLACSLSRARARARALGNGNASITDLRARQPRRRGRE